MIRVKIKTLFALIVAGAIGLVAYGWSQRGSTGKPVEETATAVVKSGPIQTAVTCTGRVVPNLDVEIKCKASGEIIEVPVDVSDHVEKGDLLLQIDPIDEQRMVQQAEATLAASQAKLETARTNLAVARRDLQTDRMRAEAALKFAEVHARDTRAKAQRMKELLEKKLASPEECETAQTTAAQLEAELVLARIRIEELKTQEEALELKVQEVKLAEAQVKSDTLALEIRRKSLADTKVVAPISGVVATRDVQTGQIISSGISNVGGGTSAMVISDLSRLFVLASVDESDIGDVRVGQSARITADAFPTRVFEGRVIRIATQGENVSNVVTFEVKIEVLGEDKSLLKPEMTANVSITTARKERVLFVPVDALIRRGHERYATVVEGSARIERPVEVGLNDGEKVEVVRGLGEGETVVVHDQTASSRWSGQQQPPPPPMMPPPGGGRR